MDVNELLIAKDTPAFEYEANKMIKSMSVQERSDLYSELMADKVANMIMQEPQRPNVDSFLNILNENLDCGKGDGKQRIDERLTDGKVKRILDALETAGYCEKWRAGKNKRQCAYACKLIMDHVPGKFIPSNGAYEYKPFEDYFKITGLSKRVYKIDIEGAKVREMENVESIIIKAAKS